jgi:superfamily II DNA or RNA helicase
MTDIIIRKVNETYLEVVSDMDTAFVISDSYSFRPDGYRFMPEYKAGRWDGYIRMFNMGTRRMLLGLKNDLIQFCEQRNYSYSLENFDDQSLNLSDSDVDAFISRLNAFGGDKPLQVRGYQRYAIKTALNASRSILKATTGAGKSFIQYALSRYLSEELGLKVLILVPTVALTTQMKNDFADYSSRSDWSAEKNVHTISAGLDKDTDKPIVVSTFQSIYKMPVEWYEQFGAIIGDEGHKIKSSTISSIFMNSTKCRFKIACTGTLHDMKCHLKQMIGLTGDVVEVADAKDLIAEGQLVPLKVSGIILTYDKEVAKAMKKADYETEIKYIVTNTKRNKFIANLALKCKGTTLLLYRFIDLQGDPLYKMLCERTDRTVHFIDADVDRETREEIRQSANKSDDDIIVGSYGCMSTGINLPAIENIIFCHPVKSKITVLQSIGRGLRLKEGKTHCNLYDITDNMTYNRKQNTTFSHFSERVGMYGSEGHSVKLITIPFE